MIKIKITHLRLSLLILSALSATWIGIYTGEKYFFSPPSNTVSAQFWEMHLPDVQGKKINLSQFRGQFLVINFWASWCPSCVDEIPDLINLYREFSPKNVQFLGIALDSVANVQQFQDKIPIPYAVLIAINYPQLPRYFTNSDSPQGLPITVVISPEGQMIFHKMGRIDHPQLRKSLLTALP